MTKKEAAPEDGPDHASTRVSDGLDDALLAHAAAARAAHVVGGTLVSARDSLPDGEYQSLLHHVTGVVAELYAARLAEVAPG